MCFEPVIIAQVGILVCFVALIKCNLFECCGGRVPDFAQLRVESLRETSLDTCCTLRSHVNHTADAVHPGEDRFVTDRFSGGCDGRAVATSLLDRFTVNDELDLFVRECLINDELLFARASGSLDNDEGICCLHKPCPDLVNVALAIIPDGIHASFVVIFLSVDEIFSISLEPLVESVIF